MKIDGSCHCGKITFETYVDPAKVALCNCWDCQKLFGGTFRVTAKLLSGIKTCIGNRFVARQASAKSNQ